MTETANVDGKKWLLSATRNMSFWHDCSHLVGCYHFTADYGVPVPLEQIFLVQHGTETAVFFDEDNLAAYAKALLAIAQSFEKLAALRHAYEAFAPELLAAVDDALTNTSPSTWKVFLEKYARMCAGLNITLVMGRIGTETLIELIRTHVPEEKIAETIATISYPSEHTPLFRSQLDLLEIAARIQKNQLSANEQKNALSEWLEKYQHIPINFCDEPWSTDDAKSQLADALSQPAEAQIKNLSQAHDDKLARKKQLLSHFNDIDIATLAESLAVCTSLNEFRKGVFSKVSLKYRPIFSMLASKGGSSNWRDCFYLTPEETEHILEGKRIDIPALVSQRTIVGCKLSSSGKAVLTTNDDILALRSLAGFVVAEILTEIVSVKGFSANKGWVTGIAKIVLSSKDFHKLQPGEILVTTMTSVDFVPVMSRAAAFVTNEGGITSHASIVAREMNKPCVIGTKIATQVFKDGDMVEVDAEKGVVKILQ